MTKTGKFRLFLTVCALLACLALQAAELEVNPSSTEISEDENLSVEFKTTAEGYSVEIGKPHFAADDFDEVNSYAGMSGIESSFINGKITVRKTESVTVVLHPKRVGKLKIKNISIDVNGKKLTAPDIEVEVGGPGSGSQKQRQYTYGSPKSPLPRTGVSPNNQNSSFFLKTEPSKVRVYKGEQILLTYALYTQVNILGIQVERYPTVPGFLKEDLEIPLLSNRLVYNRSVVGGKEYNRTVLAQYAIFPVKEGKLTIDALTGKFSYQTRSRRGFDDDDAFGMLNQFLNSMQATTATKTSDRVEIEVLPLPAAGQPKGFTGLVGDFDVTSVADKYTLKAGEPLNVKVKVEGRGHAGSLEHLNVPWPADFEQYEDKSSTQFTKNGRSVRIFDFMLIPRVKGKYQIPAIELPMFNPEAGRYEVKRTQAIDIEVLEGEAANQYTAKTKEITEKPSPEEPKKDLRYWLETAQDPLPIAGWMTMLLKWVSALAIIFTISTIFLMGRRKKREQKKQDFSLKETEHRLQELRRVDLAPEEVLAKVEALLKDYLFHRYRITKGSLTRSEVREQLELQNVDAEWLNAFSRLIEHCENIRYIPGGSSSQETRKITDELAQLITKNF